MTGASSFQGSTLARSSEPFDLMVEAVTDYAIFMLDPQGFITSWNRGAERIKGYGAEEIIGVHFSVFYPPEAILAGDPEQALLIVGEDGQFSGEGWRVRKDGSLIWASVVITAVKDEAGRLLGYGKVTRDLTERKEAEARRRRGALELASSLHQLTSVLSCTSDCVLWVGRDWTVLYGNRRAEELLDDFAVGLTLWSTLGDVPAEAERNLRLAMDAEEGVTFEHHYLPGNSWFRVQACPSDDGIAVFMTVITPEKVLESRMQVEQVLREKRVEALSIMAGGLAHEISNPLAIIHGRANDLLGEAQAGEPLAAALVSEVCESIVQTSNRAMRILQGLRGFAREGMSEPMRLVSVSAILEQCLELQEDRYAEEKVELRVTLERDSPQLLCRDVQIEQIVTNLLTNACDAIVGAKSTERWVSVSVELFDGDISD